MELNIGNQINRLRRERDITQEEFASVLGVSYDEASVNNGAYPRHIQDIQNRTGGIAGRGKKLPVEAVRVSYHCTVLDWHSELYQHYECQYSEPSKRICRHGIDRRNQTAGAADDCLGGGLVFRVNDVFVADRWLCR